MRKGKGRGRDMKIEGGKNGREGGTAVEARVFRNASTQDTYIHIYVK